MSRTNLLQRLKPEFKEGLESNRARYTTCVDSIEGFLGKEIFYSDLTIYQIKMLHTFSNIDDLNRPSRDWRFGEDVFLTYNDVC